MKRKKKRKMKLSAKELWRREVQRNGENYLIDDDGGLIKATPVKMSGVRGYSLEKI